MTKYVLIYIILNCFALFRLGAQETYTFSIDLDVETFSLKLYRGFVAISPGKLNRIMTHQKLMSFDEYDATGEFRPLKLNSNQKLTGEIREGSFLLQTKTGTFNTWKFGSPRTCISM